MKYIDNNASDVIKSNVTELTLNKSGEVTISKNEKVFAKRLSSTTSNEEEINKYYILTHNNMPYDPYGIDSHREKNLNTVLRTTSKQVFDDYITYLKTKNRLYMTKTQRNFIHV